MMMIQAAACALHAEWCGEDVLFTGVSTDSRSVKNGDLFIALRGKNFDGHKFVAEAKDRGAVAAMVDSRVRYQDKSRLKDSYDNRERYSAGVRAAGGVLAGTL